MPWHSMSSIATECRTNVYTFVAINSIPLKLNLPGFAYKRTLILTHIYDVCKYRCVRVFVHCMRSWSYAAKSKCMRRHDVALAVSAFELFNSLQNENKQMLANCVLSAKISLPCCDVSQHTNAHATHSCTYVCMRVRCTCGCLCLPTASSRLGRLHYVCAGKMWKWIP